METSRIKFDLMKDNPELDLKTLNFVWDRLWRSNACNKRKNAEQRTEYRTMERIMTMLEGVAK